MVGPLLELLSPLPTDVVEDPEPGGKRSAWRCYRRALEETPAWATHRLVVQDDATPCAGFAAALERAVAARPDRLVVLCALGEPTMHARRVTRARDTGRAWAELDLGYWVAAIAVCWPVDLIGRGLEFVDAQNWPPVFTADDEIIGRIAQHLGLPACATVPSLVEHLDLVESVGRPPRKRYGHPGRLAAVPLPAGVDASSIEWAA